MDTRFVGTGVALVSPFHNNGHVDTAALKRLVNKVISEGVQYIVALGTTAETPTLTDNEKETVLDTIIAETNQRVPIICGVGSNNTQEVCEKIQHWSHKPLDGWLIVAPYYNKPSQEGIYQHYTTVCRSTSLPVILYNVPGRTSSNILPDTAIRIHRECKNVIAIKEASGSIVQNMELVQKAPSDFLILSGDDNLSLAQIAIGMQGVISVAANCFTTPFTQMIQLALDGSYNKAREIHYTLLEGIDLLFTEGNPTGVKYVLHQLGIIENQLRLPLVAASNTLEGKLNDFLTRNRIA